MIHSNYISGELDIRRGEPGSRRTFHLATIDRFGVRRRRRRLAALQKFTTAHTTIPIFTMGRKIYSKSQKVVKLNF